MSNINQLIKKRGRKNDKKLSWIIISLCIMFACLIPLFMIFFGDELSKIPEKEDRNSILWRIEKDGKVNYLMGTVHQMCEDEMMYEDLLDDLVESVDVIVFESEDSDDIFPAYGKGFLGVDIPDSYKLINIYSYRELREAENFYESLGYPSDAVDMMMNMDIVSSNFMLMGLCGSECEIWTGSEIYIESVVDALENTSDSKQKLYLEDEYDMKRVFLDWIDYTYNQIDLSEIEFDSEIELELYNEQCSDEASAELMEYYNNNDPQGALQLMNAQDGYGYNYVVNQVLMDGMIEYMINERDRIWLPRMIDIMNKDKALFAVGALHVLDLVDRLEAEGYALTPLDISSYK